MKGHTIRSKIKIYLTSNEKNWRISSFVSLILAYFLCSSLRLVDGVEVIQETQSTSVSPSTAHGGYPDGLAPSPDLGRMPNLSNFKTSPPLGITMTDYSPPSGHADVISDITMVQGSQSYIVSASKDGVIKIWKWKGKNEETNSSWHALFSSPSLLLS